jgi:hypothetical protein
MARAPESYNGRLMPTLDRETLEAALIGYEQQKKEIDTKIEQLRDHLGGLVVPVSSADTVGNRVVSVAARKRMAAAQQKRWAAKRADESEAAPAVKTATKKATGTRAPLSPEARERIAAAQRKRWAKTKRAAKKAA